MTRVTRVLSRPQTEGRSVIKEGLCLVIMTHQPRRQPYTRHKPRPHLVLPTTGSSVVSPAATGRPPLGVRLLAAATNFSCVPVKNLLQKPHWGYRRPQREKHSSPDTLYSLSVCVCLFVCLSVCLSLSLSLSLSHTHTHIHFSLCLSACLSVCLSVSLSVSVSVYAPPSLSLSIFTTSLDQPVTFPG